MTNMLKRLLDFVTLIMIEQCGPKQVPQLAHKHLFKEEENDTAVYAYGPYEDMEHHSAEVLVVKFINDDGLKVFASWQGILVTVESNIPFWGDGPAFGDFGIGGDWWKLK